MKVNAKGKRVPGRPLSSRGINGSDFYRLRMEAGFNSWPALAEFLGVTVRTVENWQRDGVPLMVEKFLRMLAGDLSFLGKEWNGWRIAGGCLFQHGVAQAEPHEILSLFMKRQIIEQLEVDKRKLQDQLAAARAQVRFQSVLDVSFRTELP